MRINDSLVVLLACANPLTHYCDVTMSSMASQITSLKIVYSSVYSVAVQRKHQSSASLAFLWGPVNSRHKWPVTRKMFPFDDIIIHDHHYCYSCPCTKLAPVTSSLLLRMPLHQIGISNNYVKSTILTFCFVTVGYFRCELYIIWTIF